MSNKPISVGDMVMTIKLKPCCGNGQLGVVFIVQEIREYKACLCLHCRAVNKDTYALDEFGASYRLSRLKRIPPLTELDSIKKEESVPA